MNKPNTLKVGGFKVLVCSTPKEVGVAAAKLILGALHQKPDLLMVTATGGSPTETYSELATEFRGNPRAFDRLRIHKLDEWGGLDADDPGSCETYLRTHLLEPLRIPPERYFGFRPNPPDPAAECRRVSKWLYEHGPVDVCILGLGLNGHLALNEPADALPPFAHKAVLSEESKNHPMLAHARRQPTYGMGLGLAEMFAARHVLLLVNGAAKAHQLRRLLHERLVYTRHPASFLWLHPNVTCICDEAAFAECNPNELAQL